MGVELVIVALIIAAVLFFSFVTVGVRNASSAAPGINAQDVDWNAIADDELQAYLPDKKIMAIRRYRELTAASLRQAKDAVEYAIAHPDAGKHKVREASQRLSASDTGGAGVRDLIAAGQLDEAVRVYAEFMGVDPYTAQAAVVDLAQAMRDDQKQAGGQA